MEPHGAKCEYGVEERGNSSPIPKFWMENGVGKATYTLLDGIDKVLVINPSQLCLVNQLDRKDICAQ